MHLDIDMTGGDEDQVENICIDKTYAPKGTYTFKVRPYRGAAQVTTVLKRSLTDPPEMNSVVCNELGESGDIVAAEFEWGGVAEVATPA